MAERSELRKLVIWSNKALASAKRKADDKSRKIEAKYRDEHGAILVTYTAPIFIGRDW